MKYIQLVDNVVKEAIQLSLIESPSPCILKTEQITNKAIDLWNTQGLKSIKLNNQRVGMAMQRLGYTAYHDGKRRGWIIE